jgi:hypothetical protein
VPSAAYSGFPSVPNTTLGGARPSSQCRTDPASDLRRSPTSPRPTPSGSPPSIFRSQCTPRSCGCTDRGGRRRQLRPLAFRSHTPRSFKRARDLDAEVAEYRSAGLRRVAVEENVVAVSPQPRLAANEVPDLADSRPPRRANCARCDLAPHRGQLAGMNSLYVDEDRHCSIVN